MQALATDPRPEDTERLSDLASAGPEGPVSGAARVRVLIFAVLVPLLLGYVLVAGALAAVVAAAAEALFSISGVLLAAGPGWLAAHQVPLEIARQPLGVLPLLPTVVLMLVVARSAASAARRLRCTEPRHAIAVVAALAGAHAFAGLTVALLCESFDRGVTADPLTAFLLPGVLAGVAATVGVAGRCGLYAMAGNYLDPLALSGLRAGLLGIAALVTVGGLVVLLGFAFSVPELMRMFDATSAGSAGGMLLLSAAYLPNALIGGASFAAGSGFSIGSATFAPAGFQGGDVPGLPILAALPAEQAAWWPALLVLPALAGALAGWKLRACDPISTNRIRAAAIAGAVAGFGCVLLGTFAGGRLADGPFDPVAVPVAVFSVAASCWIAFPAMLVVWFAGPSAPVPEPVPDETPTEVIDAVEVEGETPAEDAAEVDDEEVVDDLEEDDPEDDSIEYVDTFLDEEEPEPAEPEEVPEPENSAAEGETEDEPDADPGASETSERRD